MVDPITLTLTVSSGVAGLLIGKVTNRKKEAKPSPLQEVKEEKKPSTRLNFISITEEIDVDTLLQRAKSGEPVFINVKPLRTAPYARNNLLRSLSVAANLSDLIFQEVAADLFLLGENTLEMRVEALRASHTPAARTPIEHALDNLNIAGS
ncbi:MAG: hypothetical protein D6732_16480 [Methanobacteriota archaeon]|nr:MAG: hypothetical protein D6732_16480 [Euryarchaeota archaeon]